MANKDFVIKQKTSTGYDVLHPETRAEQVIINPTTGSTLATHVAEDNQNAHKAKSIVLEDVSDLFIAGNVEEGMKELFTNVSNGKRLVGTAITDVDDSLVVPTDPSFSDLDTLIRSISTGKKWASGNATRTTTLTEFEFASNTTKFQNYRVSVGGLDFKPSFIFVYELGAPVNNYASVTIYAESHPFSTVSEPIAHTTNISANGNSNGSSYGYKIKSPASVTQTGFVLPISNLAFNRTLGTSFGWIAFE